MRIIAFAVIAVVVAVSCGLFVDSSVQSDEGRAFVGSISEQIYSLLPVQGGHILWG